MSTRETNQLPIRMVVKDFTQPSIEGMFFDLKDTTTLLEIYRFCSSHVKYCELGHPLLHQYSTISEYMDRAFQVDLNNIGATLSDLRFHEKEQTILADVSVTDPEVLRKLQGGELTFALRYLTTNEAANNSKTDVYPSIVKLINIDIIPNIKELT